MTRWARTCALLGVVAALSAGAAALGQERSPAGVRPRFGTKDRILYHAGFSEFTPERSSMTYDISNVAYDRYPTSAGGGTFLALAHIPSGAELVSLELDYCDTSTSGNHVSLALYLCDYLGQNCFAPQILNSISDGCNFIEADLTSVGYTVDNNTSELVLSALINTNDLTNRLVGAYIGYKLQVSPAPGVATFSDVPTTSPQFKFVEALVAAGITAGCGGGNYCPDQPITRGQMAVFLSAALGLHWPN